MAGKRFKWLKNGIKSTYNVGGWFGMGYIGGGTRTIAKTFKSVFSMDPKGETFENFDQAVEYYGLSEEDLVARRKGFKLQVKIYLVMALLALAYMIYLFFDKRMFSGTVMIPVTGLALMKMAQAQFYYSQLHRRRLVRSLAAWWGGAEKGKKNEK
ncbi:MAG: hypothetical protein GY782_11205 [Gammaproteobacteria bacterium]|nr:hypothetical protein [Gammaproteobacteria bacterium]